jgi:predicted ATPase
MNSTSRWFLPRGLFVSGKFDQYKRDIPYATLAQAFQSLLRPLLSKSEEELHKWRDALRDALDPNGQLIVDLVPELQHIIGEQPPVTELPLQDAQARFNWSFDVLSAFSPDPSIRWRCFSTTCNGLTPRRSICSKTC